LIVVVPFLESNAPANENVQTGWRKQLAELPDSTLYARLYQRAGAWLRPEGLVWLAEKAQAGGSTKRFPNRSETVPELREQGSGFRAQGTEPRHRERGAGEVQEGERGEPRGALRCASQLEAAPLRAPGPCSDSDGGPEAALERKGNGGDRSERLRRYIALGFLDGVITAEGYTLEEIQWARRHSSAYTPPARCRGLTKDRTECAAWALPGSEYCRLHQGQGGTPQCA
jgi:hypothetical protein